MVWVPCYLAQTDSSSGPKKRDHVTDDKEHGADDGNEEERIHGVTSHLFEGGVAGAFGPAWARACTT